MECGYFNHSPISSLDGDHVGIHSDHARERAVSTHYVVEINIKSVTLSATPTPGRARTSDTTDTTRVIDDVTRVVFKGDDLHDLIGKTILHLDLERPARIVTLTDKSQEELEQDFRDAVAKKPAEWRDE
jgi:hypothetical protein